MIVNVLKIAGAILSIIFLMGILTWVGSFFDCISEKGMKDPTDCLTFFIISSPPVQEAQEIADACDEADSECFVKIGEKALTEKIKNYPYENN